MRADTGAAFEELVARQRTLATEGASPDQWVDLARRFLRLADRPGPSSGTAGADQALFAAGIAFFYAGRPPDYRQAARTLETLIARHPQSPQVSQALYWCAKAYEALNRPETALHYYARLVNEYPNSAHQAEAWARLTPPPKPVPVVSAPRPAEKPSLPAPSVSPPAPDSRPRSVSAPSRPVPAAPPVGALERIQGSPRVPQQFGLGVKTVVVDAGHGGHDAGATAPGLPPEKDIALDVAKRVAALLRNEGVRVLMTREDDTFLPLRQRNSLASQANADIFVSVHANAATPSARGVETWVCAPARDAASARLAARENLGAGEVHQLTEMLAQLLVETKTEESRSLAVRIQEELAAVSGSPNRGVREAGFVVLLGLRVPSVLVEIGFLTHPTEGKLLATPEYRQRIARAIAQGVLRYSTELAYAPSRP
jgi:N-acetylmuramoyl-L-alanine amidase